MSDVFDDIKFPKLPQVDTIICLMMMQERLLCMPGATICVYARLCARDLSPIPPSVRPPRRVPPVATPWSPPRDRTDLW